MFRVLCDAPLPLLPLLPPHPPHNPAFERRPGLPRHRAAATTTAPPGRSFPFACPRPRLHACMQVDHSRVCVAVTAFKLSHVEFVLTPLCRLVGRMYHHCCFVASIRRVLFGLGTAPPALLRAPTRRGGMRLPEPCAGWRCGAVLHLPRHTCGCGDVAVAEAAGWWVRRDKFYCPGCGLLLI